MAGIHDEHDLVVPGGYPGKLRDLMGVWVEEIDALAPDETIEVHGDAVDAKGEIVASIIHREGARRLAAYGGGEFYAGHSALTVNTYGKGKAYFVGTPLDETGMSAFMAPIIKELGLKPLDTPEDVACPYAMAMTASATHSSSTTANPTRGCAWTSSTAVWNCSPAMWSTGRSSSNRTA